MIGVKEVTKIPGPRVSCFVLTVIHEGEWKPRIDQAVHLGLAGDREPHPVTLRYTFRRFHGRQENVAVYLHSRRATLLHDVWFNSKLRKIEKKSCVCFCLQFMVMILCKIDIRLIISCGVLLYG